MSDASAVPVYSAPRAWTRLHPISPVLRAWPAVLAVGFFWFYTAGPSALGGGGDDPAIPSQVRLPFAMLAGIAVLVALVAVGFGYLGWRFTAYRLSDDAVEYRKGVLFRQQQQARLDRLQAVDVVQPLAARLFGFAQVKIEVAGGENANVVVEYLRLGDAEALRNEVVALAAGYRSGLHAGGGETRLATAQGAQPAHVVPADAGMPGAEGIGAGTAPPASLHPHDINPLGMQAFATQVAAAPEQEVFTVPVGRLAGSILRSWGAVWAAAFIPLILAASIAAATSATVRESLLAVLGGSVAGVIGALTGLGAFVFAQVNSGYGFRAAISADGIRLRHGLMETRRQTVPPGRIQAVRLRQSLLWRRKDWWQVSINVAGYKADDVTVSRLLPVGDRSDALLALHLALPDVGDADPEGLISLAMSGKGAEGGFTASPRAAAWLDPLQWRHRGVRATETALLIRSGLLVRDLVVVPHERTQSLRLHQGPVQRALGLASVSVQSTPGPVNPVAHHLGTADAVELLTAQAQRARRRRTVQTPEQWARAVGAPHAGDGDVGTFSPQSGADGAQDSTLPPHSDGGVGSP